MLNVCKHKHLSGLCPYCKDEELTSLHSQLQSAQEELAALHRRYEERDNSAREELRDNAAAHIAENDRLKKELSQERAKREEAERFTKELTVGLQASRKMRDKAEFDLSAAREALRVLGEALQSCWNDFGYFGNGGVSDDSVQNVKQALSLPAVQAAMGTEGRKGE